MPKLVFIHIPKTGGTSVTGFLNWKLGKANVLHVWEHGDVSANGFKDYTVPDGCRAIAGHLTWTEFVANTRCGKVTVFSLVRDPIERARSLFNHIHPGECPSKFHAFAESIPSNRQTQFLTGLTDWRHVYPVEFATQGLVLALKEIGVSGPNQLPRLNRTSESTLNRSSVRPETEAMIRQRNAEDCRLYNWAQSKVEAA